MVKTLFGRHAPSGRAELLDWINTLCCASYSSLEQLGDGVLYCQVLEMILVDAPCFLQKLPSFDCIAAGGGGPSEGLLRERRERNLGLFQVMCRQHLPKRLGTEINTTRLAEGKLQDHMLLAKWLFSRASDAAKSAKGMRFLVDAELRRVEAACGVAGAPGDVGPSAPSAPKALASELEPAPDAVVRMRRQQALAELTTADAASKQPPAHQPLDLTAGDRPQQPPNTQAPARDRPAETPVDDPETEALLQELQGLLAAKAQRTAQLQQHLEQFVEMRNGLAHVSEHLKQEAAGSRDRALADEIAQANTLPEAGNANVFSVLGEALRP